MKKLILATTVLSMLGLSFACNRSKTEKVDERQMEETKDNSMNSGNDSLDEEQSDMDRGFNDVDREESVEETETYDR